MKQGVFITGTDTGVGKTRIGAALAWHLSRSGLRVRPRKPVESGCAQGPHGLVPQDAMTLREAAGGADPLDRVCRYRLRAPLSPERAARLEGLPLSLGMLYEACRADVGAGDFLLVEGAGGFYSPMAQGALNADLAGGLGLPVLVVAADRLGALNHTLLTVEAIRILGLALAGLVLNQPVPRMDDGGMDNAEDLARWLRCPVLRMPHSSHCGAMAWHREADRLITLAAQWSAP
jgi:dethiobiotin synthetase